MTDALLDTFPVSRYDASLAEVLKEIGQYQGLGADWDGRLSASAFTDRSFTLDGPEPDGRQNVAGDFALYSAELVAFAEILTEEETLA